jgi:hypothetical protein
VEYQTALAPDPHDPLHELLDDLGDVIDVDMLIGKSEKSVCRLNCSFVCKNLQSINFDCFKYSRKLHDLIVE